MKKAKLSLKSKASDSKQPKISNFFLSSKTQSLHSSAEESSRSAALQIKDEMNSIHPKKSSDLKVLCSKCHKKSPASALEFCSGCNIINSKVSPKDNSKIAGGFTKQFMQDAVSKENIKSSPDFIPPTPPLSFKQLVSKGNKKVKLDENPKKSVKRKFNFNEASREKKICAVNSNFQNEIQIFDDEDKDNRIVFPLSIEKENLNKKISITPSSETNSHDKISNGNCSTSHVVSVESNFLGSFDISQASTDEVSKFSKTKECSNQNENRKCQSIHSVQKTSKIDLNKDSNSNISESNLFIKTTNKINKDGTKDCQTALPKSDIKRSFPKETEISTEKPTTVRIADTNILSKENNEKLLDQIQSQGSDIGAEDICDNFSDDISFDESAFEQPIRLDNGARCKVISVDHLNSCAELVLRVQPCDVTNANKATAMCVLRSSWAGVSVHEGDIISITAKPLPGQPGCWTVDSDFGLLVTHSDTLVSGTTIVGSLFCMRRSVLSDMYRGMDSESSSMAIGSFLHELLQEVLKRKVFSLQGIKDVLSDFISTPHFVFSLYSSGMSLEKTKETLNEFVPKIHAFVQTYLMTNSKKLEAVSWSNSESWGGKITDIADIEENIWVPRLGVKGKVDVTVQTSYKNKQRVMPLELKTGRASFSAEHRGQVILYTMMMSELGQQVDSGLLLYLREGVMKEVCTGPAERRDLILLRNQLVTHLRSSQRVVYSSHQQVAAPELPPPINHHSACSKCPYLTLCSAVLRSTGATDLSESNPLHGLSVSSTAHLTQKHMEYVFHWSGLLRLENSDSQLRSSRALHHIWTLPPVLRQEQGTCVANTVLAASVTEVAGSYEHVFEWSEAQKCFFVEGDYVIVSSNTRPAVAAGPVRQVGNNQLTLFLERDLCVRQKGEKYWHLDRYESQSGLLFNTTNLGCLLDNTEQAGRLRRAVVDLDLPVFRAKLSSRVLKTGMDLLEPLNDQQHKAIFKVLAADHYILIKGLPGTGKTATIAALVELAVRLGQSVLITSHTHSAVDNLLLRLCSKIDFLRLGSAHKLHPTLADYSEAKHLATCTSPEQIQDFYNSKKVVAVTCLGSAHPLLSRRQFDLCVVDEATQVLQPTVLRPLFSARKFVLIGDPNQLPPLVRSSEAKELGLGQSLFERLDRPAVTSELSLQYRMNQCITNLANSLTYAGKLKCASPAVAEATLTLPQPHTLSEGPEWLAKALSDSMEYSVLSLDTGVTAKTGCVNQVEADIVIQILTALQKAGLPEECVGVIAPYRAQVGLLRTQSQAVGCHVEVNTVDQYQGRDKHVILLSCTQSAQPTESDILADKNRLTVAITRAKHKLILIGNVALLRGYSTFQALFSFIPDHCILSVS